MNNKIYITCLHLKHGGVEMAISLLSNALVKYGYSVEILCTYNFGTPAYKLDPEIKINYLTSILPNREAFLYALSKRNIINIIKEGIHSIRVLYLKKARLKRAIRQIDCGTIISTRNEDSILVSKYGHKQVTKIAQLHHDHKFNAKIIHDFQKKYTNIDYFVLLTDTLCQEISEFMRPYNSKTQCITIPNFLPSVSSKSNHIPKKRQVIAVGRLHTDKAFHRLIDAWAIVASKHPDWILKIIGEGELDAPLKKQVEKLHLSQSIIFTGALSHDIVMSEMSASSIYAMTSISEAFPFVLLEALQNSLPVIAFDVRVGPRALIEHNKTGFLIPDNDILAFSKALCNLIENPKLLETMQHNAFFSTSKFTEETIINKWLQILR